MKRILIPILVLSLAQVSLAQRHRPLEQVNVINSATASSVVVTIASGTVLPANAARKDAVIVNYGASPCTLSRSGTAIYGQGIFLAANGGSYLINSNNLYNGTITAITSTGTTTLAVSEGK